MELVGEVVAGTADPLPERVAALDHETVDHPVEDGAVVVRLSDLVIGPRVGPLLGPFRQAGKIRHGIRRFLVVQADREMAFRGDKLRVDWHSREHTTVARRRAAPGRRVQSTG
jgi:hypothetical protein